MPLDPKLLRDSFQLVVDRAPDLTTRFYAALFRRRPELEVLFHRRPRATQEQMLAEALSAVLDHLEDAPWLTQQLGAMGARHADYGVTRVMYDDVGAALLEALADAAGSAWSAELEGQWTLAYGAIRDMMWAGAGERAPASERAARGAATTPSP
jgi:hemoglobin-like flavoprotein